MATSDNLIPTPSARDYKGTNSDKHLAKIRGHHDQLPNFLKLNSSQVASPASPLVLPGFDVEQTTSDTSGLKCLELYDLRNPNGSSLRTCVASLLGTREWYSKRYALIWKPVVTKSNRLLFQLSPSTPRTAEIESGLLLTPSTVDRGERSEEAMDHRIAYRKSIGRKTVPPGSLSEQIVTGKLHDLLKTPSASEAEGGTMDLEKARQMGWNPKYKMRDQIGDATGLKLQPNFVAWMMGFEIGWCDFPMEQKSADQNTEPKA